jgi:hypothetical protein
VKYDTQKTEGKETYETPQVLASYSKEELEEAIQPEVYGQSGCMCGCGCGCSNG